ncbi:MAG: hypothetical protein GY861_24860 [bacterium]|nr:hypothetical protein [bacterium]
MSAKLIFLLLITALIITSCTSETKEETETEPVGGEVTGAVVAEPEETKLPKVNIVAWVFSFFSRD